MNIYDLLRRLVEARPFSDAERVNALELVDDMQRMAVFGTVAAQLTEADHICSNAGVWFPDSMRCGTCSKPMAPPPHSCVPVESSTWASWRTIITLRCKVCNREM